MKLPEKDYKNLFADALTYGFGIIFFDKDGIPHYKSPQEAYRLLEKMDEIIHKDFSISQVEEK